MLRTSKKDIANHQLGLPTQSQDNTGKSYLRRMQHTPGSGRLFHSCQFGSRRSSKRLSLINDRKCVLSFLNETNQQMSSFPLVPGKDQDEIDAEKRQLHPSKQRKQSKIVKHLKEAQIIGLDRLVCVLSVRGVY
jgi:hypothetical protein